MLLRTVRCVNGTVDLYVSCEPAFDYHRGRTEWRYTGKVYEEATAVCRNAPDEHPTLRMTTDLRLGIEDREVRARRRLHKGDTAFVALSWADCPMPHTFDEAVAKMVSTQDYWREWITTGRFPDHPWRTYLQRSALTLKGLTYSPTGALLAASTTSLPETPGGERNWDYRYAWVRDSTFALWGLYTLGFDREADDFFSFILDVSRDADGVRYPLQVMYGVGGERELPESTLGHLSGYDGATPVRIGNDAITNSSTTSGHAPRLGVPARKVPRTLPPDVAAHPAAAGRGGGGQLAQARSRHLGSARRAQHFVSSKVMCWVALDRGAKLAELQGRPDYARKWAAIAEEIKADVLEHGVDERGVFTQRYGHPSLDASALLIPLLRFLPADDPRVRATVLAIADELTEDGLVLRYRVETTDDGLAGKEARSPSARSGWSRRSSRSVRSSGRPHCASACSTTRAP